MILVFLMCFGLVMLYSTSAYSANADFGNDMFYFSKQAIISVVSFAFMLFVSKLDYHVYGAFSWQIYYISLFLMLLVKTPLGVEAYGSRRWLQLPGKMTLQPSEIAKIAVILLIPYEICRLGPKIQSKKGIERVCAVGAVAAGGVMVLTDNLSTAIIILGIAVCMLFVASPKYSHFLIVGGVVLAVGVIFIALASYRAERIQIWLHPEEYEKGYQTLQGLYAIGSGGLFGKGLGESMQKLGFIPEAQNDMIFSVICEELGLFGAICLILLYLLIIWRFMVIANNAADLYGALLVVGIMAHISIQVVLNIAVVTNTIPNTGISLPFVSYGGTSILFLLSEMGLALSVSRGIKFEVT